MDDKIVTLEGKDVLNISVDSEQLADKNAKAYHRARYAGKVFTVPADFYAEFIAGEVARVTIATNEYKVEDPENPGEMLTRIGWAFSGYATYAQIIGIENKQGQMAIGRKNFEVTTRKMDIELMKLEKEALATVKLDDAKVDKLTEAV
jgi:hypothetical protein